MHVVLDTNTFFTDLRMGGAAFEQLFESRAGLTLCLPAVVVEEAVAHFARQLEKLASEMHRLNRTLGRASTANVNITEEQNAYRDHLVARFQGDGRKVLPLPATPHEALVRRATRRTRPFQEGGTGYRDALIWDSILAVAASAREPVVLVSNNTRDFAASADGSALHTDLVDDLKAHGLPVDSVRLLLRVDELLRDVVRPRLKSLGEMATALSEEAFQAFSLRDWIEVELGGYVEGEELDVRESRQRHDAISVSVIETGHVDEFEVEDVYELPSHAIGIEFNADVETYLREDFDQEDDDWDYSWEYDFDGTPTYGRSLKRHRERRSERFHKYVRYRARLTVDPQRWVTVAADVEVCRPGRGSKT